MVYPPHSGTGSQLPVWQSGNGEEAEGLQGKSQQVKGRAGEQAGSTCTSIKVHFTSSSTLMPREGQGGQVMPSMPVYKRRRTLNLSLHPASSPETQSSCPMHLRDIWCRWSWALAAQRPMTDCDCLNGEAEPWSSFNPVISWVSAERHLIKAC